MRITKDFTFDAAHRLVQGYEGKCAHVHGHTYRVEVALVAEEVDRYGFVLDFSEVSAKMKGWVMERMDHATLVSREDVALLGFLREHGQKHWRMLSNPTAEAIAEQLFQVFSEGLQPNARGLRIDWVRVWETPTSSAVYSG